MNTFTADLYRDPLTGSQYVVVTKWGPRERDTNGSTWEPMDFAGPLSPKQLATIRATGKTDGLDWREDFPEDFDLWKQGEQIWADVDGGEP